MMRIRHLLQATCVLLGLSSLAVSDEPFESCPSQAFLFQGNPVQTYGVDLLTGQFELLQTDAGMPGNINGVGFSFDDRFLYGFNTTTFQVVRLDKDFKAEALPVTGLPTNTTFYVGDVSDSVYWVYRKNVGLYAISIDENHADYLVAQQIPDADVRLNLTDFAFHPQNGALYAVDNKTGNVYKLDTQSGQFDLIGASGVTGTFGAAYFDVDGYLYLGRNSDGHVFRLDLTDPTSPDVRAQLFAQGPHSNQNDGARCAFAPVVSSNVDWGDAPDTYQTTLENNGARHGLDASLFLGSAMPDGETLAAVFPNSDDAELYDDEDGVSWQRDWVAGLHQALDIQVTGTGYLSIWVDWQGDGSFDESSDVIVKDYAVSSGAFSLPVIVPMQATPGPTWMRVRLSDSEGTFAYGGASRGEVEDYSINIQSEAISQRYFPSVSGWSTLAFEDQWPVEGDYDFNDVVVKYRLTETTSARGLERVDIVIAIQALGATYRSGFGVHFPGLESSVFDANQVFKIEQMQRAFTSSSLSDDPARVVLSENLHRAINAGCAFYRTVPQCDPNTPFIEITLSLPVVDELSVTSFPSFPYNPFIFGTQNIWRGSWLQSVEKNAVEVHLVDNVPTSLADSSLWGIASDDSQPILNRYYRTSAHLPWALLFYGDWQHPKEGISILTAYPSMQRWVESDGQQNQDWYLFENGIVEHLY